MAKMGRYCKAYPITQLREFSGWVENSQNTRKEKRQIDGAEVDAPRELTDEHHLYLQENLTVTDGIFLDENIVFDAVTPEWKEFTVNPLKFEVPDYEEMQTAEKTDNAVVV
jgi:hypothetical protein